MRTLTTTRTFTLCFTGCIVALLLATASPLTAAENWKETFDLICGSVQGAESMSEKEIASMMEKADKLMPVIQASDDPAKKVYITRLKKCRGVYEFMLDTKKGPGK